MLPGTVPYPADGNHMRTPDGDVNSIHPIPGLRYTSNQRRVFRTSASL